MIPSEMGVMPALAKIDIGCNPFIGGFPIELGNLGASSKLLSNKRPSVAGFRPTELYWLTCP